VDQYSVQNEFCGNPWRESFGISVEVSQKIPWRFVLKKYLKDYIFLLTLAGVIIVVDQITKALVRNNLAVGEIWAPWPWLIPYARLVHWTNTGAAFGMFQHLGGLFTILAFIVSLAILYYFPQVPARDWPLRLALAMQLGGAVGNLIDRLTIGSVVDFISLGNFAVFNVADASISIGAAVLVLAMWIKERGEHTAVGDPQEVSSVHGESADFRSE
jgi:signal peptidase II